MITQYSAPVQPCVYQVRNEAPQLGGAANEMLDLICVYLQMISSIADFKRPFFIGVAGAGMSAIAQYLQGIGKQVTGSDRFFKEGEFNETRDKLEKEGITCFVQD